MLSASLLIWNLDLRHFGPDFCNLLISTSSLCKLVYYCNSALGDRNGEMYLQPWVLKRFNVQDLVYKSVDLN